MLAERRIDRCTDCAGLLLRSRASTQLPLLYHGGYGEAIETVIEECRCRIRVVSTEATTPRLASARATAPA